MKTSPLILALLCTTLALPGAHAAANNAKSPGTTAVAAAQKKVVYHVNDSALARIGMRNAENHLSASPDAKIVFVAHGKGIDFLLNDAKDEKGACAPGCRAEGKRRRVPRSSTP